MYSNNTPSILLLEFLSSYLLANPFKFNIKQVRDLFNEGVAKFFAWAGLFRFEITRKGSADDL